MKKALIYICIFIAAASIIGITILKTKHSIQVDKTSSYYSDFTVAGEEVLIRCEITVINYENEKLDFKMNGDFSKDVNIGLLTDNNLKAYSNDNVRSTLFSINNGEKKTFSVVFIGKYAGTNKKANRELPEITIEMVH